MEVVVRMLTYLAMVVTIPFACAVGTTIYADDAARIQVEHATRVPVQARVVSTPQRTGSAVSEAIVRWDDRTGTHKATAEVSSSDEIGSERTIWVDPLGEIVTAPRDPVAAPVGAVATAVLLIGTAAGLGWGVNASTHQLLDRRRLAAWETDWRRMDAGSGSSR